MSLYSIAWELSRGGKKPFEVAAEHNIRVMLVDFSIIKGIALSLGENRFILIDAGLSDNEQQLVCGHEIGHFFMHPETNFLFILQNTCFYSKHEYQANRFACELMLGEKAAMYSEMISQAAASGRMDRMLKVINLLINEGGEPG